MRNPSRVLLLLAVLSGFVRVLPAQDTLSLDPSVTSVVTGGFWEAHPLRGHYRIVVWSGGGEHVSSKLRVEWILEDSETQENRVIKSAAVDSIPDWVWSLGEPRISCTPRRCQLTIEGTEPHVLEKANWVVTLRAAGRLVAEKRR